ncbi:MAG: hypothetical protein PWQ96_1552 [Clostridia bacterium]|jgi:transcriptional regulator with PAS, ATPase and Fis domain|nr:proprionate catabolism activator, Fis family [Clostridiales bacterium]MDK2985909.1 hypothetical protein [Clostridia bacterium]
MNFKIGIIAPYRELVILARNVVGDEIENFLITEGRFSQAVERAKELKELGVEVIISRGATAMAIQKEVNLPIVDLQSGDSTDLLKAILEAKQYGRKILVTTHRNGLINKHLLEKLLDIEIMLFYLQEENNLQGLHHFISGLNVDVIVGGADTYEKAVSMGFKSVRVDCSKKTLEKGITRAKLAASVRRKQKLEVAKVLAVSEAVREGIIAINNNREITLTNPAIEQMVRYFANANGKNLEDILPEGKLKEILLKDKRGFILEKLEGKEIIANVRPIIFQGRELGSVAMISQLSDFREGERKIRKELAKKGLAAKTNVMEIIGQESIIESVKLDLYRYAKTELPVLIYGETGTGKEMVAQSIHNASNRRNGPFVALNCGGLMGSLLESELFGYEQGAFTDAHKDGKLGLFEIAHGGTLFLDEISEIPLELQSRLLRVLEEKMIRPLGSSRMIPVDVRIITATNRDLKKEVKEGRFRKDLYYRLNVLELTLPPLRKRQRDIPLLAQHFLHQYASKDNKKLSLSSKASAILCQYQWPGNIRQLKNVMERLVMLSNANEINEELVKEALMEEPGGDPLRTGIEVEFEGTLREMESKVIRYYLKYFGGNKSKTAEALGISRVHLSRRLKQEN